MDSNAHSLQPQNIRGTWSGVLLPIGKNNTIDWTRLGEEVDSLLNSGVDGIYTSGTAEECWTLSASEFSQLGKIVSDKANALGMPFQIGASNPSPQIMRERVLEAKRWAPGAIQIILPDYYATSSEETLVFLKELAQLAAPIGLVLYNPGNAKWILQPSEFAPLAQFLIGVKVVDKDRSWYTAMKKSCGNLSIAVTGHHFASGVVFGANASYSNVAALSPCGAAKWYHSMIKPGLTDPVKLRESLDLEDRIGDFFQEYVVPFAVQGYSDMALDKLLAEIGGWSRVGTELRWPYKSIPTEEAQALRRVAHAELPELFECSQKAIHI